MIVGFAFVWTGLLELQLFFRLLTKISDFGEAWVGSAVEYGPYQEFGTQFFEERPHWRVAIAEIVAETGTNVQLQNDILEAMVLREMGKGQAHPAMHVALKIERRVKQIMTAKGIIETGNYRASVAAGRTLDKAFEKSAALADADTVAA